MLLSILAVCLGACCGAVARWGLNCGLNALFPALPPGTLAANLLGGFLMGLAMAMFTAFPQIDSQWRLLIITGFLGSLTTFSAFSGEMSGLVASGKYFLCLAGISLHVGGSIIMVFLGMFLFDLLKKYFFE